MSNSSVLVSPELDTASCSVLGLSPAMRLRWMAPEHQPYMRYHRQRFMAGQ